MTNLCQTEFAYQRQTLLENSLLELMESVLYQDISVKDICQKADIPRRTFYHYFDSKEAVLNAIIDDLMRQCFLTVIYDLDLDIKNLHNSFVRVFRFWEGENRRKLNALIRSGLEFRLISWSSSWVKEERVGFLHDSNLDPKLVKIGLMVGITDFFTLLFYWSRGGYQETPEQMAHYAVWVLPQAVYHL